MAQTQDSKIVLWNVSQFQARMQGLRPVDCHAWFKEDGFSGFCSGCEVGDTFRCEHCGRLTSFCKGADDNDFGLCDDCWSSKHREEFALEITIGL